MSRWIKYYSNSTYYIGCDSDPRASWRKSNANQLCKVVLEYNGLKGTIVGPGEYWQSDLYESVFPGASSNRVSRRIMRKLEDNDRYMRVHIVPDVGMEVSF